MAKLLVDHASKTSQHFFIEAERLTLGRDSACALCLDDAGVSKEHARLITVGNDHILEDLQSTNGTTVNGERITKRILQNRDLIVIGPFQIRYVNQRALDNMDFDRTMMFDGNPAGDLDPDATLVATTRERGAATSVACLVKLAGPGDDREIRLDQLIRRIGTAEQAAALLHRPRGIALLHVVGPDTRLNGNPLDGHWPLLADGDEIEIGNRRYRFQSG